MSSKSVNIEHQKLHLIQEFLAINSTELLSKLSLFIQKEKKKINTKELKPMSMDAFNQMIEQSEQDISKGRITEAKNVKKIVSKWS